MKKRARQWRRGIRCGLGAGTLLFLCPGVIAAQERIEPQMSIGEDRFNTQMKLNLSVGNPRVTLLTNGELSEPIRFYIYNNYPDQIASYEIRIYEASDVDEKNLMATFTPDQVNPYEGISWSGSLADSQQWQANTQYKAILEVTGKNGKKDRTLAIPFQTLSMIESKQADLKGDPHWKEEIPGFGIDQTDHRGIISAANGGKAVIQLGGLTGASQVQLNGETVLVDESGRAMRELILPSGTHTFTLSWVDEAGATHTKEEKVQVGAGEKRDFFFVAMADLTWSKNTVTGAGRDILVGPDPDHYDGTGNWDGRLLFYLKGNLNDQYRLTAHLDTNEERLKNVFGHIGDKDPRRFTRELDPMDYYPIYGDGSTVESDVDTQGKFYIKLEKGKDHLLWGNYNTGFTGTEFASFNRSLYGAQYYHESLDTTKYGQPRSYANIFAATSETRGSHNEFLSTGGSLYFLKHQRVTTGTLKLTAEIRDENTGRLKNTVTLSEGTDFEIDNFQGRILLTTPLPMTASGGVGSSIISGGSLLNGDQVWLVADYEYYSDGFAMDEQGSQGIRGYRWLGDHFRIGGSYVYEEQEDSNAYKLFGVDLTWKPKAGTYTYVEYAQSDQSASDIYSSDNGGLNFNKVSLSGESTKGKAWKIDQTIDFSEFTKTPLWFNGYYSKKEKGFSSFADAQDQDLTEWGAELKYDFEKDKKGFLLKYTSEEEEGQYRERIGTAQYYTDIRSDLRGAIELQDRRENNYDAIGETRESLLGVKLEKDLRKGRDKVYLIQQVTLSKKGDVADNNKTTLGYETQIRKDLKVAAEVFGSNRGAGGGLGVNWDANDRASFYTKVSNDIDSNAGRGITTTVGGNWKATSQLDLYSEKQFQSLQRERSTSDVYGVNYKPHENQTIGLSYSTGTVRHKHRDQLSLKGGSQTERDVWTLSYGYNGSDVEVRNKLEYRWETGSSTVKQWVTTNRAKTKENKGWSWLTQFDYARTTGDSDVLNNFTEAAIGFAFRPINHNRLNLFGKISYVRGMDPEDQFIAATDSSGNTSYFANDYEQRSMVYALEGIYELNPRWQVAFKAAHREGELRYRGESEWFSSGASLYAARINYSITKLWDFQLEYRTLRVDTAKDNKNGWVTSIFRKIGNNAKVGVGYNWTDYNDDLTRLNYNSKGWFVNLVGKW